MFVESPPFGDKSPGLCRPAGAVERSFGEFGQRFRPTCSSNCSLADNLLHVDGTKTSSMNFKQKRLKHDGRAWMVKILYYLVNNEANDWQRKEKNVFQEGEYYL